MYNYRYSAWKQAHVEATITQIKTQRSALFAKAAQACDGIATTIKYWERNCCTSQADSLLGGFKIEDFICTAAFSPPQK